MTITHNRAHRDTRMCSHFSLSSSSLSFSLLDSTSNGSYRELINHMLEIVPWSWKYLNSRRSLSFYHCDWSQVPVLVFVIISNIILLYNWYVLDRKKNHINGCLSRKIMSFKCWLLFYQPTQMCTKTQMHACGDFVWCMHCKYNLFDCVKSLGY